jgi:hypothetical protein
VPSIFNDPRAELRRSMDFGEWCGARVCAATTWAARHVVVVAILAAVGGTLCSLYRYMPYGKYRYVRKDRRPSPSRPDTHAGVAAGGGTDE